MSNPTSWRVRLQILGACVAVTVVLLPLFLMDNDWPVAGRDYLEARGREDTGAINLVSAIYLGYRAFDTLGETIVLLVAVSGTIGIAARAGGAGLAMGYGASDNSARRSGAGAVRDQKMGDGEIFALPDEKRKTHALRTHLLEVVTGKLGPVVLVFGLYVMLYGHLSPGGGFQGGVVIASGIVFLALGSRADSRTGLNKASTLACIEAAAFLLLILVPLSGMFFVGPNGTRGFFANPIAELDVLPAGFIILLNAVIGLKVGAGIGFMCVAMLGKEEKA